MAQQVFVARVAGTDDNKLDAGIEQPTEYPLDQIQTLLVGQAGNHGNHHDFRIDWQTEFLLELRLIGSLSAAEGFGCISLEQFVVGGRVVNVVVDAIDNARERVRLGAEYRPLKPSP